MKRHLGLLLVAALGFATFAWAQPSTELKGHTGLVAGVAFDKDGKILASGSYDGTVKLRDVASAKAVQTIKASD